MKNKENKADSAIDKMEDNTYIDDVFFEEGDGEEALKKKFSDLKEKLKKCLSEKKEYLDGWQRAKADFLNFKKTEEKERAEFVKFAKEGIVSELVSVLDSFQMAFSNKEAWGKTDKNWRVGIEYIHSQLMVILEANGLEEISPSGGQFDPLKHDCAETEETGDESKDGEIIKTTRSGYALNGKIVRPAKVTVAKFKKE